MNDKLEILKQKTKDKPLYNMSKDEIESYIDDIFEKYDETSNIPYKYRIRSFKELYKDIADIDFDVNKETVITGEEYEDWVKEKFRDLTSEEEQAYVKCLDNISKSTGVNLYDEK